MLNEFGGTELIFILIASLFLLDIKKVAYFIKWFKDLKVKLATLQRDIESQISEHLKDNEFPLHDSSGVVSIENTTQVPLPSLTDEDKVSQSMQICRHITTWDVYITAKVVAGYMPLKNEPDLMDLYTEALNNGKELYFPRVEEDDSVRFIKVNNLNEDLENGPFGRKQPKNPSSEQDVTPVFDFIFIPGVSFSQKFQRMGHRKDFYANLLSVTQPSTRVGVAFHQQIVECSFPPGQSLHIDGIISDRDIVLKA